ncbi:MAG TPA: hypothetical protein VJB95_00185 [Candidatus Paceibacterota bacterium]
MYDEDNLDGGQGFKMDMGDGDDEFLDPENEPPIAKELGLEDDEDPDNRFT